MAALSELLVSIHHIDTTAIPGIAAKPVTDILIEVEDVDKLDDALHQLEALGYQSMGEFGMPGQRYFLKSDAAGTRTHHVHAFAAGTA